MAEIFSFMKRCISFFINLTGWISALSLVASAIIVTEAVIVRKVFGISTVWQTEAAIFLLIFVVFVGAPFVQKNEQHLNVDLVLIHLSPRRRELTLIIVSIISCMLCGLLAVYAWPMWWEALIKNEHSESLWGPPLWIPYLFLPLGMSGLFFQYIIYIAEKIHRFRKGEFEKQAIRTELKGIELDTAGGKNE